MKLYVTLLWFEPRTSFKSVSLHVELPLTLPISWSPKMLSDLIRFVALPAIHLLYLFPPLLTFCSLKPNFLTTSTSSYMSVSFMTYSKLLASFLECTEWKFRFMFHYFYMITDRNIVYSSICIGHVCFHTSIPIDALKKIGGCQYQNTRISQTQFYSSI